MNNLNSYVTFVPGGFMANISKKKSILSKSIRPAEVARMTPSTYEVVTDYGDGRKLVRSDGRLVLSVSAGNSTFGRGSMGSSLRGADRAPDNRSTRGFFS